jgi:hypothetical protein
VPWVSVKGVWLPSGSPETRTSPRPGGVQAECWVYLTFLVVLREALVSSVANYPYLGPDSLGPGCSEPQTWEEGGVLGK